MIRQLLCLVLVPGMALAGGAPPEPPCQDTILVQDTIWAPPQIQRTTDTLRITEIRYAQSQDTLAQAQLNQLKRTHGRTKAWAIGATGLLVVGLVAILLSSTRHTTNTEVRDQCGDCP